MKVLVTGSNGQLGRALQPLLPKGVFTDSGQLDIANSDAVDNFNWTGVQAIINAAAYTNVDGAEQDQQTAHKVNADGVANLARIATKHSIPLVQVSTDYVFDGTSTTPYQTDSPINPKSVYGSTKAAGEQAAAQTTQHHIVRTSWVYGDGSNFVRTMLRLGRERDHITVVGDQIGRPTNANDLANVLVKLLQIKAPPGIYHATNAGEPISWADFATEIFKLAKINCVVEPITTSQYLEGKIGIAPRPAYSVLALDSLTVAGITMPDWRESLQNYLNKELLA